MITKLNPLINPYGKARETEGMKKVLIASGLRYDLAVEIPEYVREFVTHHVGGFLNFAPQITESATLSRMMKPGIGSYDRFAEMFERGPERKATTSTSPLFYHPARRDYRPGHDAPGTSSPRGTHRSAIGW